MILRIVKTEMQIIPAPQWFLRHIGNTCAQMVLFKRLLNADRMANEFQLIRRGDRGGADAIGVTIGVNTDVADAFG
jgi:hypothetical protein